jgi:hypothetical protein
MKALLFLSSSHPPPISQGPKPYHNFLNHILNFGLTSFKNAIINGQSGSTIETIGNTKMLVTYQPVNVFHNTWAVLLMQEQ